jgi:hypothetical protein
VKKVLLVIIALALVSCGQASLEKKPEFKRRNLEEYFVGTGVVRYFLPDIPAWANFSSAGLCQRQTTFRFFDLPLLRGSFSLEYEQAVQLQLGFNQSMRETLKKNHVDHIPFKDEEELFFAETEKIHAGIRTFRKPKYKRVHLIWIDHLLDGRGKQRLKRLMNSSEMDLGHPVFVSICLSRHEMYSLLKEIQLLNRNIRLISFDLFSPYDSENKKRPYFSLNFEMLFDKKQKFYFYTTKNILPPHFEGSFQLKKI